MMDLVDKQTQAVMSKLDERGTTGSPNTADFVLATDTTCRPAEKLQQSAPKTAFQKFTPVNGHGLPPQINFHVFH